MSKNISSSKKIVILSPKNNLTKDGPNGFLASTIMVLKWKSQNNQKTVKKLMNHLKLFTTEFMLILLLTQKEDLRNVVKLPNTNV